MNIKVNNYTEQVSYSKNANDKTVKSSVDENIAKKEQPVARKDTISISVEGKMFSAEKMAAVDSKMGKINITSDLESFRTAVKSMNEPLTVNWNAVVDPYGVFRGTAKVESRLMQLQDPTSSKNDNDMERVSNEYADSVINKLIEKKKAMLASGEAKTGSAEYNEYKTAYDAYHLPNGSSLIELMDSDTKKAYNIYKNIIDGTSVSLEDEEFLALRNRMMYTAAKGEYYEKQLAKNTETEENNTQVQKTAEEVPETSEKEGGKVAVNVGKRMRQIAAAADRGQLQQVMTILQEDMADCKAGLEKGWCDESEIAKVESLIAKVKEKMGQVPQTSDNENSGGLDAFAIASLM